MPTTLAPSTIRKHELHRHFVTATLPVDTIMHPLWKDYCRDAEEDHGGVSYWTLFKSADEVQRDFDRYVKALG